MRFDHVAVFILDEGVIALIVLHAQQLARRRADADGEDVHARFGRLFGRRQRFGVGVMVFAVGEEHEHFMIVLALFKRRQRSSDGGGKGCAALWNDADIEGLDALAKSLVVEGEGRLQKGGAGKSHQAKPVVPGLLHQVEGGQFRLFQAIRRNVLGQHAARGVHGDDDVQPFLFCLLPGKTPLGPGQGQQHAGHGGGQQGEAKGLAARGNAHQQIGQQTRLDELPD